MAKKDKPPKDTDKFESLSRFNQHQARFGVPGAEIMRRTRNVMESAKLPEAENFREFVENMGFEIHERVALKKLQSDMWKRTLMFGTLGGLFIIGGLITFNFTLAVLVGVPSICGFLTSLWRYQLLQDRKYVPFKEWLLYRKASDDEDEEYEEDTEDQEDSENNEESEESEDSEESEESQEPSEDNVDLEK